MSITSASFYKSFVQSYYDHFICLASVPGIGRQTVAQVLGYCWKNKIALLDWWESRSSWEESGLRTQQRQSLQKFQEKWSPDSYGAWLKQQQVKTCVFWSGRYPPWLRHIDDFPWLLFYWGAGSESAHWSSFWNKPGVAIVGTRKQTPYGQRAIEAVVSELAGILDVTVVSGFMIGADCAAHRAAQSHNLKTVAVLGYGKGSVYPASLIGQYRAMEGHSNAVFVSEHPPGTSPRKAFFPLRNRIVAGMSQVVVVSEADVNSGSLITAQLALDYGRTVGAIPGSIFSQYSSGVTQLIKSGATTISSGLDVAVELKPELKAIDQTMSSQTQVPITVRKQLSSAQQEIYGQLQADKLSFSQLLTSTKFSTPKLQSELTHLELLDLVECRGSLWYTK